MRLATLIWIAATAPLFLSACAGNPPATVKPNPFPRPPASLLAPTDKPTLLEDWNALKAEFLRSLSAGTAPSPAPKPAGPGSPGK